MFSFTGCTGCWIDPDPMIYDQRFDKGNIITTLVTLFFVEQILDFDIQDRPIEEIRETRNFLLFDIRRDANLAIVIFASLLHESKKRSQTKATDPPPLQIWTE